MYNSTYKFDKCIVMWPPLQLRYRKFPHSSHPLPPHPLAVAHLFSVLFLCPFTDCQRSGIIPIPRCSLLSLAFKIRMNSHLLKFVLLCFAFWVLTIYSSVLKIFFFFLKKSLELSIFLLWFELLAGIWIAEFLGFPVTKIRAFYFSCFRSRFLSPVFLFLGEYIF